RATAVLTAPARSGSPTANTTTCAAARSGQSSARPAPLHCTAAAVRSRSRPSSPSTSTPRRRSRRAIAEPTRPGPRMAMRSDTGPDHRRACSAARAGSAARGGAGVTTLLAAAFAFLLPALELLEVVVVDHVAERVEVVERLRPVRLAGGARRLDLLGVGAHDRLVQVDAR